MKLLILFLMIIPHLEVAKSFLGITERSGKNDGKEVEMFLSFVGRKKGDSWCAAFVSYCLWKSNVKYPKIKSGLAQHFRSKNSVEAREVLFGKKIPAGSLVIWQKGNSIYGHIGFVIEWERESGITIEGNTSPPEDSKSIYEGVFIKKRKIEPANYFRIRWFEQVIY